MTGDQPHDLLEELIAADVLHGLGEDDRQVLLREMARHGAECEECRRLAVEYSEAAGWLAFALEPHQPSAQAEERLIAAARGAQRSPDLAVLPGEVKERSPAPSPSRVPWGRRWAGAAAVAALLAVAAGAIGYSLAPGRSPVQVAAFPTQGQRALAVAYQPGAAHGWVIGSGFPTPPDGKVYELWFTSDPKGPLQPAGTFLPKGGSVVAPVTLGASLSFLAVSVEPRGGSRRPTSAPILTLNL